MFDFEKLGAFYLGKQSSGNEDVVLYDSKDLNTHGVIVGMTGSGKTGLGVLLLEEALIDKIPVIAVDPKGDLGNMLLTFPKLAATDFAPWVTADAAERAGQSTEDYAASQAELWRNGLADWGMSGERIKKLRDSAEMTLYTPGSNAGVPLSPLNSLGAPRPEVRDDSELFNERISATATGILSLLGIDADPIKSGEHLLLSNIFKHRWTAGKDLSITDLITAIQRPGFDKIGIMDLDSVLPARERDRLALQLNGLIASPGFESWLQGAPLKAGDLLYTDAGKPKLSILSIAHLSERERMFVLTLLLNELIAWMRAQPGTSSLRAILYIDEIMGYVPPVANPPSKTLLLTLMKQARAYGVGLVLSTQNPIDLDYKALSNAGTWFIGRLQTERDKARLLDGLASVDAGQQLNVTQLGDTIAALDKREFLLHNVHENEPVLFKTRWAMSYLAGPLTRNQIRRLSKSGATGKRAQAAAVKAREMPTQPAVSPEVTQYFLPLTQRGAAVVEMDIEYQGMLVGAADLGYSNARYGISERKELVLATDIGDGPVPVDWDDGSELTIEADDLEGEGVEEGRYVEPPATAHDPKNYRKWEREFKRWLRQNQTLILYRSKTFKTVSLPQESEGEFRGRLQTLARERRDQAVEKLRKQYETKFKRLHSRLESAEHKIQREQAEASGSKFDVVISAGRAILGAFLGRKAVSVSTVGRAGQAVRSAGRARKQAADVKLAQKKYESLQKDLAKLEEEFEEETDKLEDAFNAEHEELSEIRVQPKSTDIQIHYVALAWAPYSVGERGRKAPLW